MASFTVDLPNGKKIDIEAADETTALNGAKEWYAQNVTSKNDTTITGALSQGAANLVSGVGNTLKNYGAPETGKAIQEAGDKQVNPNYRSAVDQFSHPDDGADNHFLGRDWSKAPRALIEQAPGMAADVAASLLAKRFGPIGQALASSGMYALRTMGGEAEKRAVNRTGDPNAVPDATDKLIGAGSTAVQAGLNSLGTHAIVNPSKVAGLGLKGVAQAAANTGKAALTEGVTNAAQDAVSQGASTAGTDKGLTVDPHSIADSFYLGTAGGGAFAGMRGAKDAGTAARFRNQEDSPSTTYVANRILDKVKRASDLENPSKAFEAFNSVKSDIGNEFAQAAKEITAPSKATSNAIERVKSGEALNKGEMDAIDAEGNSGLSDLARQVSAIAKLQKVGSYDPKSERFAGGLGEKVRSVATGNMGRLAGILGGSGALGALGTGAMGIDTALAALPGVGGSLAAAGAGYKGLKTIEKALGVQSPVRTFAEKFGDATQQLRAAAPQSSMAQASVSVPQVTPQNSLTTPQPWGPVAPKPERFKPDMLESNIGKIVDKLQNQKRRDTIQEAMPLLRELAEHNKPVEEPKMDVQGLNEQVKGALLMASARRKLAGQQQAEAEAANSEMINDQGGLDALSNPAFGTRANELIKAANAMKKLRATSAEDTTPEAAPQAEAKPEVDPTTGEVFSLPEDKYAYEDHPIAAEKIYQDAIAGGKEVRNAAGYKAATVRRRQGEEEAYMAISNSLGSVKERGDFHKYLAALLGSDSPPVVKLVREKMLEEFPQAADVIRKELSDEKIDALWTPPKKK